MKRIIPILIILVVVGLRVVLYRKRKANRERVTSHAPSPARQFVETTFGDVGLVATRELRERTRGRIFRIGTLLILAVVAAAIVIPKLNKSSTPSVEVAVIGPVTSALRSNVIAAAEEVPATVRLTSISGLPQAERRLRSGSLDAVIDGRRIVVDHSFSTSDSSTDAQFAEDLSAKLSVLYTLEAANLSSAQTSQLDHPINVPIEGLSAGKAKPPVRGTTIIGLILLFVLLSQYSAWILMGVAEEKSSRVVEVLLATVKPIHLLAGKVLGIGAAALSQATVIVVFALVLAKAVGSDLLQGTAPADLLESLLWLVIGYAFYCWVYAAAGSLMERASQLQSMSFPLSIPMLVGYVLSITTASTGDPTLFFKVLAYLPPTAPFAMPVLASLGAASWWQIVLSAALSIAATFGVARLATGIYQRAILQTGQRVRLRDVLRLAS